MTRRKKDIPIVVLETIEPYLKSNNSLFELGKAQEGLLRINDSDPESDFYFEVVSYDTKGGRTTLVIDYKPRNRVNTGNYRVAVEHDRLDKSFSNWVSRLEEYERIYSIYDDPILKKNQKEFLNKFELADEDADYAPFNLEQQLLLEEFLEKACTAISQLKKGKTDEETDQLEALVIEASEIKSQLTKESKRKIINRLSKFLGGAQKLGLEVIKAVSIGLITELAKRIL